LQSSSFLLYWIPHGKKQFPIIFAKENDAKRVNTLWVEIASLHHALQYNAETTKQQVIELSSFVWFHRCQVA